MEIKGRTFVVSGGASGLGAACVCLLADLDANVVIADLDESAGHSLALKIGARVRFVRTDVTEAQSAADCLDEAEKAFGTPAGLINCAGIAPGEKVLGKTGPHSLESFQKAINVNLVGSFNMTRLAADRISRNETNRDGERGVIVNTASIAAFDGQIGQAAYAASKGGVAAMTLPLARELARVGIRVMTIAPGIFETPMLLGLPADVQMSLGKSVPFPARLGRPGEFAALVRHIIENPMLNGEVIRLDGALRMAPR